MMDHPLKLILNMSMVKNFISRNLEPIMQGEINKLLEKDSSPKKNSLEFFGEHRYGLDSVDSNPYTMGNIENQVGLKVKIQKFNPSLEIQAMAKCNKTAAGNLHFLLGDNNSIALEYEMLEFNYKVEVPASPLPPIHLDIPMNGVMKSIIDLGGRSMTISRGLRVRERLECNAHLCIACIGWPITIGGELKIDCGLLKAAINVSHKKIKLGGEWRKSNEIGFQIETEHIADIVETITGFGFKVTKEMGTPKFKIDNHINITGEFERNKQEEKFKVGTGVTLSLRKKYGGLKWTLGKSF